MNLTETIKTVVTGQYITEESKYEHDLSDMGRSEKWHKHSEHYRDGVRDKRAGYPSTSKRHFAAAKKIHDHVSEVHGKDMADDMQKHSELHSTCHGTVGQEMKPGKAMLELRRKHNIKRKDFVTNWAYTGQKDDK